MKKYKKVFVILLIIIYVTIIITNNCFATNIVDELGGDLDDYKGNIGQVSKLTDKANVVIGIIRNIGVALSVIILIAIGIKYMLSSVEERAEYKKSLIPYIVGALFVFTISVIPSLIYELVKSVNVQIMTKYRKNNNNLPKIKISDIIIKMLLIF